MKLGYLKDLCATICFFIILCVIKYKKNLNNYKKQIISLLTIAFIIDGLFSLNPTWHCNEINANQLASALVLIGGVSGISIILN